MPEREGGPCCVKLPGDTVCGATSSTLFYGKEGAKVCRKHYLLGVVQGLITRRGGGGKRPRAFEPLEEEELERAGGVPELVWIKEILGVRCVAACTLMHCVRVRPLILHVQRAELHRRHIRIRRWKDELLDRRLVER